MASTADGACYCQIQIIVQHHNEPPFPCAGLVVLAIARGHIRAKMVETTVASLHARWGPEAAPPGNLRITSVVHLSPNLVTLSADNFKAGDELVAIIGIVAVTEAPVLRHEIPPDAFAFARVEAKFWPLNADRIDNWLASAHLERPASAHTA